MAKEILVIIVAIAPSLGACDVDATVPSAALHQDVGQDGEVCFNALQVGKATGQGHQPEEIPLSALEAEPEELPPPPRPPAAPYPVLLAPEEARSSQPGAPSWVWCGTPPDWVWCSSGTYGCYTNSQVGACAPTPSAPGSQSWVTCAGGNPVYCSSGTMGCYTGSDSGPCASSPGGKTWVYCEDQAPVYCSSGTQGCYQGSSSGPCEGHGAAPGNKQWVYCSDNTTPVYCSAGTMGCYQGSSTGPCAGYR